MTAIAMPVARPMSRAGLRYSPLSEVTASQPAKAHTSSAAAEPTASQPCGANGVRLPSSAWGSETSVAASSSPPRTNAMTSCTRPQTRRPNQFIAVTRRDDRAGGDQLGAAGRRRAQSATYAPAKPAAVGAPIGIAK